MELLRLRFAQFGSIAIRFKVCHTPVEGDRLGSSTGCMEGYECERLITNSCLFVKK